MAFGSSNPEYSIVTDSEVSSVIEHFDDEMINDIIDTQLNNKYRSYAPNLANIVASLETNFKQSLEYYNAYQTELIEVRKETFSNIILKLCNYHNLTFVGNSDMLDHYSAAFYLYSFFVSDFSSNLITFLTNYIIREQNSLYQLVKSPEDDKKPKDSSTVYSKKVNAAQNEIGVTVHAHLDQVIDNICAFDIDLQTILTDTYFFNKSVSQYICSLVQDNGNYFQQFIVPYIKTYRPIIITNTRLSLQEVFAGSK